MRRRGYAKDKRGVDMEPLVINCHHVMLITSRHPLMDSYNIYGGLFGGVIYNPYL